MEGRVIFPGLPHFRIQEIFSRFLKNIKYRLKWNLIVSFSLGVWR